MDEKAPQIPDMQVNKIHVRENENVLIQANEKVLDPMEIGFEKRPQIDAMIKGARGTCPSCGKGRLFSKLLTTRKNCSECGED